jgi:hypothetical protein
MFSLPPILDTRCVVTNVDPVAFLVVPLMAYASDGHAILAIEASLIELGKRLRKFLFGWVGSA